MDVLKTVRAHNPGAQIVWACGMLSDTNGRVPPLLRAAVARYRAETGDGRALYLPLPAATPETLGARQHPPAQPATARPPKRWPPACAIFSRPDKTIKMPGGCQQSGRRFFGGKVLLLYEICGASGVYLPNLAATVLQVADDGQVLRQTRSHWPQPMQSLALPKLSVRRS